MSLTSLHPTELSTSLDRLTPRSPSATSLEEMGSFTEPALTIEELRAQLNSCFSCGVSWTHEHVTLDCSECGGYALQRPCPLCQDKCGSTWERDRPVSHAFGKARWHGVCAISGIAGAQCFPPLRAPLLPLGSPAPRPRPAPRCSAAALLARDLCQRLEKLSQQQQRPS